VRSNNRMNNGLASSAGALPASALCGTLGERQMDRDYRISLVSRGEVLSYSDSQGTYLFDVSRKGRRWTVYLPPDLNGMPHEMTEEEAHRITSKIVQYVNHRPWPRLLGSRHSVTFAKAPPFELEAYLAQQEAEGWKLVRNPDGSTTAHPPEAKGILKRLVRVVFS